MTGMKLGNWLLGEISSTTTLGPVFGVEDAIDPIRKGHLQLLQIPVAQTPEFLTRFPGEMLALQRLKHPNIVRYQAASIHAGTAYFVEENHTGQPLIEFVKKSRRHNEAGLDWRLHALSLAAQLASAFKHAHHRNVLHRDLSPSQVVITPDGGLKVTQFGIAKVLYGSAQSPLQLPPDSLGTIGFLAPEFFMGKPFTRKSDIYSLGGLFYYLLTGRPLYSCQTAAEFMHKHCYVLPDRPSHWVPNLPVDFEELICVMLHKDPSRRPASVAIVLEVLESIRSRAERKGEPIHWPVAPLLEAEISDTVDASLPEIDLPNFQAPTPLLSRPWVVVPLFLLVVGLILGLTFWPRPTVEELYAQAQPLMQSDDPADWDRAMTDYLEPLQLREPDQYSREISDFRKKIQDHRRLRKAIDDGFKVQKLFDAEQQYQLGLQAAQLGDFQRAKAIWVSLIHIHENDTSASSPIAQTRQALLQLDEKSKEFPDRLQAAEAQRKEAFQVALLQVKALQTQGQVVEVRQLLDSLFVLYGHLPECRQLLQEIEIQLKK